MRLRILFSVGALLTDIAIGGAGNPDAVRREIAELNECIQLRFQTLPANLTAPVQLGMSRVTVQFSLGRHYVPVFDSATDFRPETEPEKNVIGALESDSVQAGLFVFGRAIVDAPAKALNFRALKGPAAMTRGTPRPAWYPGAVNRSATDSDALPDWKAVYPLAQGAMTRFEAGATGFDTTIGSWRVAAVPVVASRARCVACHNTAALHQAVGGVLYVYRRG